ncbi:hypothetical protein BDB01DRAFT_902482 [Pilobolus umbonatus]|nr:hypothetical protein BDB01DRAFT_902482 [Pilobolus umbonatus]
MYNSQGSYGNHHYNNNNSTPMNSNNNHPSLHTHSQPTYNYPPMNQVQSATHSSDTNNTLAPNYKRQPDGPILWFAGPPINLEDDSRQPSQSSQSNQKNEPTEDQIHALYNNENQSVSDSTVAYPPTDKKHRSLAQEEGAPPIVNGVFDE